jgi:hypothetical protein
MMNQRNLPDREQVKKTLLKSRRERQKLELASLELEDSIVQLEKENRTKRRKQLNRI